MHLAERHAHLLEDELFFNAGTNQIRLDALDELFKLKAGDIVIQQCSVAHIFDGAIVVIVVTEFITGPHHFHTQIFISTNHVTRTQATHVQHNALALQARLVLVDHGLHQRLVLGDDALGTFFDLVIKQRSDGTQ